MGFPCIGSAVLLQVHVGFPSSAYEVSLQWMWLFARMVGVFFNTHGSKLISIFILV